jgi:hypothetical protein
MKRLFVLLAALALIPAGADARHRYHAHYSDSGYYTAISGHRVHRPMHSNSRPAGASARCRDGSWSFSESHRGTCSWHGGVASWVR